MLKHDEGKLELKLTSFPSSSQHHARIGIILNPQSTKYIFLNSDIPNIKDM